MLFTSYSFFLLLVLTIVLYYLPFFRRAQIPILLLSSLIFYGYTQPELVFLLLISITINAVAGFILEHPGCSSRRAVAVSGVAANLLILIFFKYIGLFVRTLLPETESDWVQKLTHIPLPLGISFFTFQGISLVVDTYRNPGHYPQFSQSFPRYWLNIAFFKSFFPQLVSGPIVKAREFLPQIGFKTLKDIDAALAFKNLVLGYFLKMVIADNLKEYTSYLSYLEFAKFSTLTLILLLAGFSFQIFSDFAGYSLIALGLARLFGYQLPVNFNFPYISRSLSEFWTRWHISLSSFLKEYLYIPLGGNRKGALRTGFNLVLVMTLGGIWHGAGWNFAIWGLFHGLLLVLERMTGGHRPHPMSWVESTLRICLVFAAISFSWLFFKLDNLNQVGQFVKYLFSNLRDRNHFGQILGITLYGAIIVGWHLWHLYSDGRSLPVWVERIKPMIYGALLFLILTNSGKPGDFIYFQF
jgi:alginate O-acetyltransferase complex protein AlgI